MEKTPLLLLDAGHGRGCPNGSPDGGLLEWRQARICAALLAAHVQAAGVDVQLLAPGPEDVALNQRCRTANYWHKRYADTCDALLVSLHLNAYGDGRTWTQPRGLRVYVAPRASAASLRAAGEVLQACREHTSEARGGAPAQMALEARRGNFAIVRDTTAPAMLVELGFMTNAADAALLSSPDYLDELSRLTSRGLCAYWAHSLRQGSPPPPARKR